MRGQGTMKATKILVILLLAIMPFYNLIKVNSLSHKNNYSIEIKIDELFEKYFIKTVENGQNDWGRK